MFVIFLDFLQCCLLSLVNLSLQLWVRHEVLGVYRPLVLWQINFGECILLHASGLDLQVSQELRDLFLVSLHIISLQQSSTLGQVSLLSRVPNVISILKETLMDLDVGAQWDKTSRVKLHFSDISAVFVDDRFLLFVKLQLLVDSLLALLHLHFKRGVQSLDILILQELVAVDTRHEVVDLHTISQIHRI